MKDPRKQKYTQEQLKELRLKLQQHISDVNFPTLAGFIANPEIQHKYKLSLQYVYNHPELFSDLLDVMTAKGENYLIQKGLMGQANAMVIFLLKQQKYGGYSDSQQLDLTSKAQPIKFVNMVPRPKTKKTSKA